MLLLASFRGQSRDWRLYENEGKEMVLVVSLRLVGWGGGGGRPVCCCNGMHIHSCLGAMDGREGIDES
jgi:hypothetical protein